MNLKICCYFLAFFKYVLSAEFRWRKWMQIFEIFTIDRNNDFRRNNMLIMNLVFIRRVRKKEAISVSDQNSYMPFLRNEFSRIFLNLNYESLPTAWELHKISFLYKIWFLGTFEELFSNQRLHLSYYWYLSKHQFPFQRCLSGVNLFNRF